VHGVIAQSPSGAWSSGAAILTFLLPMLLFIIVALGLYLLYTKPSIVPGRRVRGSDHPVSYTPVPGKPVSQVPGNPEAAGAAGNPGAAGRRGDRLGAPRNRAAGGTKPAKWWRRGKRGKDDAVREGGR
jgi:hypothetical protein